MNIINLTSHTINETTTGRSFPVSGMVARVKCINTCESKIEEIPIYSTSFGKVEGLPEPKTDIVYIVSSLVLNATDRKDVVAPGNLQRNEHGQPVGCMGFRYNS